jgi:hypothetical protein
MKGNKMKTKLFFVVLLTVFLPLMLFAKDMTPGWRAPTTVELGEDSDWRDDDPSRYLTVKADFDGDGKADTARLLVHSKENKMGLFVTMSSGKGAHTLEIIDDKTKIELLGISMVEPGIYETACGKGLWDCKKGEPEKLRLVRPGIDFFQTETKESCFWWNPKTKKFEKTWISD